MAASDSHPKSVHVPNRLLAWTLMGFGLLVLLVGTGLLAYHLWCDVLFPNNSYSIITSVTIQTTTGIHWWQCLSLVFVGGLLFGISCLRYRKSYVIVFHGKVRNYGDYVDSWGVRVYYCILEGDTRAGEQKTYRWIVSQTVWQGLSIGDVRSFK